MTDSHSSNHATASGNNSPSQHGDKAAEFRVGVDPTGELMPRDRFDEILATARSVVRNFHNQTARDFVDAAPGLICLRYHNFDTSHPSGFRSWCKTVLKHEWIDIGRRIKRREECIRQTAVADDEIEQPLGKLESPSATEYLQSAMARLEWNEAFCESDVVELKSWTAKQVVILSIYFGFWTKFYADKLSLMVWTDLLTAAGIETFDEQEMRHITCEKQIVQRLANMLNVEVDSPMRTVRRYRRDLLPRLRFVQELILRN